MKLQKTSTVEAIVDLMIHRISSGEYPAEKKLPSERLLQNELGVGRLALREALSRLNAMGIIETSHGRGTFVQGDVKSRTFRHALIPYFALSNPKRLGDLMVARGMLEGEIAGIAAGKRTEEDVSTLENIVSCLSPHCVTLEDAASQDLSFHRKLAEMIDNSFLATMHEALTDHISLFLMEYVKSKKTVEDVMSPHQTIVDAIKQGDAEAARRAAREHVSYSHQDYEEYVNKIHKGRMR